MAVPKSILAAKGLWRGKSKLNLPELPADQRVSESESSLHIETDAQNTFATITYVWHHEGHRQEGTLILCKAVKSGATEFGWVDSWHQNKAVMHLKGEDSGTGSVKARGEYGSKEVWGWSIEFLLAGEAFTMKMENITPAGEATWAVDAVYARA